MFGKEKARRSLAFCLFKFLTDFKMIGQTINVRFNEDGIEISFFYFSKSQPFKNFSAKKITQTAFVLI